MPNTDDQTRATNAAQHVFHHYVTGEHKNSEVWTNHYATVLILDCDTPENRKAFGTVVYQHAADLLANIEAEYRESTYRPV
jgi:hypothetical protein